MTLSGRAVGFAALAKEFIGLHLPCVSRMKNLDTLRNQDIVSAGPAEKGTGVAEKPSRRSMKSSYEPSRLPPLDPAP
jgi:hypothetical protein